jgi:hypothetical protein
MWKLYPERPTKNVVCYAACAAGNGDSDYRVYSAENYRTTAGVVWLAAHGSCDSVSATQAIGTTTRAIGTTTRDTGTTTLHTAGTTTRDTAGATPHTAHHSGSASFSARVASPTSAPVSSPTSGPVASPTSGATTNCADFTAFTSS